MSTPLLKTKLYIPTPRPELVSRPRLIERLNAGLQRKLTLISAPAGFGKTTLLSEWVIQCPRPVAWVSLDEGDNDRARFWSYFVAALRTIHADVGQAAVAALQSARSASAAPIADTRALPSIELLLSGLINEVAEIPTPFALVLDDFHVITNHQITNGIAFLLNNLPWQMHLVLSGRSDPPWPLARQRAEGRMTELRANDLRFTLEEAAAFLNDGMGLELLPHDIATLEEHTEGWIAGLQMAAISMQGQRRTQGVCDLSRFIKAFTGSDRFILDYLVEEVLEQQPLTIQEFLLKTSILDWLTGPLCDAMVDGDSSQVILGQLEKANLFLVPLDSERRWYRYHRLFADLLRNRMEQTWPDQVTALYLRASAWHEINGLLIDAVRYALAAGDVERVARLVEGNALAMIAHGELATLAEWLSALPEEMVRSRPWLCIYFAWILVYTGQLDTIDPLLQDTEEALVRFIEHTGDPALSKAERQHMAGHIAAIRAYAAGLRGDKDRTAEFVHEALRNLPKEDLAVRGHILMLLGTVLRWSGDLGTAIQVGTEAVAVSRAAGDIRVAVETLCDLALSQSFQGQLHKAAATCRSALELADRYTRESGRPLPVIGLAHARMSVVLREWNDLEAATRHARQAVELCKRWGQTDPLVAGYVSLARSLQAVGDMDGALSTIQEAKQIAKNLYPLFDVYIDAHEARLHLAQGDIAAASRWATSHASGLSIGDGCSFQYEFADITLARILIAQSERQPGGSLDRALALLKQLLQAAESAGRTERVIEILTLRALALQAHGQAEQALVELKRALSLAQPEGFVRIFIDEGAPMGELLRQAAGRDIAAGYTAKLLSALDRERSLLCPTPATSSVEQALPRGFRTSSSRSTPKSAPDLQPEIQLIEPLSKRELEVLQLLTTSLSTPEIAEELCIAVSTVRSHVKRIYRKLNVHRRMDAVQRAKELELS